MRGRWPASGRVPDTSATGRANGIDLAAHTTNVYELIDGKISHIRTFLDRQQALDAVGLGGLAE